MPALTSALNKNLVLRGANAVTLASLRGDIVFGSEIPFILRSPNTAPGILTQQVLRVGGTGLLTFAYQLALTGVDYDGEIKLAIGFSLNGLEITFADFRADATGRMPPNAFESTRMEGCVFKFSYGIAAGQDSRICFLATNAREFAKAGGHVNLIAGGKNISLDVAAPILTTPTRWMKMSGEQDAETPDTRADAQTETETSEQDRLKVSDETRAPDQ